MLFHSTIQTACFNFPTINEYLHNLLDRQNSKMSQNPVVLANKAHLARAGQPKTEPQGDLRILGAFLGLLQLKTTPGTVVLDDVTMSLESLEFWNLFML